MKHATLPQTISRVMACLIVFFSLSIAATHAQDNPVRLDVVRDTWVSAFPGEDHANLGGAGKLKLKGIQEMAVLDIDTAPLRGKIIAAATLHLHPLSNERPLRVTVSSLASDWTEGTSTRYSKNLGTASFRWAKQDQQPWAYRGSDITAAINGEGNTFWSFSDASAPDAHGYQSIAMNPRLIAARIAGISHGFAISDDVGSEWSRDGDKFTWINFPNRFIASREAALTQRPYITVRIAGTDSKPPATPTQLIATHDLLPPGETRITWTTPADGGDAGVIGFDVRYSDSAAPNWSTATPVPRYLIPLAGRPGERVTMHLRDLPSLKPGDAVKIAIRAIDAAGNVGDAAVTEATLAPESPFTLDAPTVTSFEELAVAPTIAGVEVCVVDALDKINPISGRSIPDRPESYRLANHIWSAAQGRIRLYAAQGEAVDFQLILKGATSNLAASLALDTPGIADAALFIAHPVNTPAGPLPDPLIPLTQPIAIPDANQRLPLQRFFSVFAELQVAKSTAAGVHHGKLTLTQGKETLALDIELHVWPFALPDDLSFIPQMNCYGLPSTSTDPLGIAFYRLAHRNRTCLNRLAYNWRGEPNPAFIPNTNASPWDWSTFDKNFAPLFDGSAFANLPRAGRPVEAFYLPINENWPASIDHGYRGGYWADRALSEDYRQKLTDGVEHFARHLSEKRWTRTMFEFFLNNKVYYKRDGWNRTSAPWTLDEPVSTQDFYALRWYGMAFHEGVNKARAAMPGVAHAQLVYRADISRPQWQRDLLDGVLDINIVGGAFMPYHRMVTDRKQRNSEIIYNYAGSNAINKSNVNPAAWCIDTWTLGGDGVLPWQTVGNEQSWREGNAESLFYPGTAITAQSPVASLRLKAYRRGQQDVEYLTLLCAARAVPRWAVAARVRQALKLAARFEGKNDDDAGEMNFGALDPVALWRLRVTVGEMIAKQPAHAISPGTPRTPPRDPASLPDIRAVQTPVE